MNRTNKIAIVAALLALVYFAVTSVVGRPKSDDLDTSPEVADKSAIERAILARAQSWRGSAADGRPKLAGTGRVPGVVRGSDGQPLGGALVCASCVGCNVAIVSKKPYCVYADEFGRYELTGLPPGRYFIGASADGRGAGAANGGRPVEVGADGSVKGKGDTKVPDEGAVVSGFVRDALGGAVGGAEVRALSTTVAETEGEAVGFMVQADAEGRFALNVPTGLVVLAAVANGYAPGTVTRSAPAQNVEIMVTPAGSISGQVVAEHNGQPIAGATVVAHSDHGPSQEATSDGQGHFSIEALRPGGYQLRASATGWIGISMETVVLDLGDVAANVLVPMFGATQIQGTLSAGGEPCRRGKVHIGPADPGASVPEATESTNADGQVVFNALPPGRYAVAVMCDGYGGKQAANLEVGSEPISGLVWELDAGAEVHLRAIDSEERPVAGVQLSIMPEGHTTESDPTSDIRSGRTDDDGELAFRGMKAGTYEVFGNDMKEQVQFDLEVGDSKSVVVHLEPVGEMQIAVVSPDGTPQQAVTVSTRQRDGKPGPAATPIGGGKYKAGPMKTGTYFVTVRDGINPALEHPNPVEVTSQGGQVEVIYGGYNGEITGRVVSGPDAPLPDIWVSAVAVGNDDPYSATQQTMARNEGSQKLTNTEGQFRLKGLNPAGHFSVIAERPSGGQAILRDIVPGGKTIEILMPDPGRLSGSMLGADGNPVGTFRIAVRNATTDQMGFHRDFAGRDDGRWSISPVAAGDLEILGQDPFGHSVVASVSLEPNGDVSNIVLRLQE